MLLTHLRRAAPILALCLLPVLGTAQTAISWGQSYFGKSNIPASIQESGAKALASNYYTSFALTPSGAVVAWGDNTYSGLNVPTAARSGVSAISAGAFHTLALKDGGVIAWGYGPGQNPVPAAALSGVSAIAAGEEISLVLKNGGVFGWGNNWIGALDIPAEASSGVQAIAASNFAGMALKNGEVIVWSGYSPLLNIPDEAKSNVVAMSAGFAHILALRADGSVVAWGSNTNGQCDVPAAAMSGVVAVSASYAFSWALKADGTLISWGSDPYGVTSLPAGADRIVAITSATAVDHFMALKAGAWVTFEHPEIVAGQEGTATVELLSAAGAGGVTVGLVSDSALVDMPATVFVPEGATSTTFGFTTHRMYGAPVEVGIRPNLDGLELLSASFSLKGSPVGISLSDSSVIGGSTQKVTGSVTLDSAAASDLTVSLTSSSSAVTLPASFIIPAGSTTVFFAVTHSIVPSTLPVSIDASYQDSGVASTSLSLQPLGGSILFDMPSITSGTSVNGYVFLNATLKQNLTVSLSTNFTGFVSVPATVTIYAGSKIGTFIVTTSPFGTKQTLKVTALAGGSPLTGNLVMLPVPWVKRVILPPSVVGNCAVTGTVRLLTAAPVGGVLVSLSSQPGLIIPSTVFVAEGQTSATFQAIGDDVPTITSCKVTAYRIGTSASVITAVVPMVPVLFNLSQTSVSGGTALTGTVTLKGIVALDTDVSLSTTNTRASVPAKLTIHAGSKKGTFTITTNPFTGTSALVSIRVTKNGKTISRQLTITP